MGIAGIVAVVRLFLARGRDGDMPGWALGLLVVIVVALSVVQDVTLRRER